MALSNETQLGLHLAAGASDGYLTEAKYVYDPVNSTSIQKTLNKINENQTTNIKGPMSILSDTSGIKITYTYGDSTDTLSIPTFSAASSNSKGDIGLVPEPNKGEEGYFLKGDGTWENIESISADTINSLS